MYMKPWQPSAPCGAAPDPIPGPVIERIFQAAAWAPTGGNVQPFRMVAVTDREKLAAMGALYSKQWDSYTSGMRAEGEQLAIPRRKMMEAGDYLCEHFHTLPLVVVFCFNANHMAITDADLDRPSVVGAVRFTRPSRTSCLRRERRAWVRFDDLLCFEESAVKELLESRPVGHLCAYPHGISCAWWLWPHLKETGQ